MKIEALIDDTFHQIESESGETILDSLIRENVDVPYSCQLGYCLVCKCRLKSGEISIDDDSSLTHREKSEGFILACQSYPKSDVKIDFD